MTDREKAIVMAYTGICMLTGTKFAIFHKYVEDIMGRPVQTIELGTKFVIDEIKEKSEADFIDLCKEDQGPSVTPQPEVGRWIYDKNIDNWKCSKCDETPKTMGYCGSADFMTKHFKYCNHCGAKMQEAKE